MATLSIIAAVAKNGVIGYKNALPWHLPADLARFKTLTSGRAVLMGRKTYESIVRQRGGPLPDRKNIILTSQRNFKASGCTVVFSLFEALSNMGPDEELFVIGGAQLYAATLPLASHLHLTDVHTEITGDTFFPRWNRHEWKLEREVIRPRDVKNQYDMVFRDYTRII